MAGLPTILLCLVLVTPTPVLSSLSNSHHLRQFNSGQDSLYTGNDRGNSFGGGKNFECEDPKADAVEHAEVMCSLTAGCRVKCNRGYKMDGSRLLYLSCDYNTGILTYHDLPWKKTLPPCLPYCKDGCQEGFYCAAPGKCKVSECDPPCQNGGTCLIADVCNCPPGYAGLMCDEHRCDLPKPRPGQATLGATTELTMMDIQCNTGYKMKNGISLEIFKCKNRQWITVDNGSTLSDIDVNCYA